MIAAPTIAILEPVDSACLDALNDFGVVVEKLGAPRDRLLVELTTVDAIVVKSLTTVDREFLDAAPKLRCIGRAGTGVENIDLREAEARGIKVVTVPEGNSQSAAELTVLLILSLIRNFKPAIEAVARREWRREEFLGRELSQLAVGLIGIGNVGIRVARFVSGTGATLLGFDPNSQNQEEFGRVGGRLVDSIDELVASIDILSVHVRQTPATVGLVNASVFAASKQGMFLVNTARGSVVDSKALLDALNRKIVCAAAVDVLAPEPPFDRPSQWASYDNEILRHPRVLATPHLGGLTHEAQRRIGTLLAAQMRIVLNEGGIS